MKYFDFESLRVSMELLKDRGEGGISGLASCDNIVKSLVYLGIDNKDIELDTNGWQVDYWVHTRYNGVYIEGVRFDNILMNISGSMYYGTFQISVEEGAVE